MEITKESKHNNNTKYTLGNEKKSTTKYTMGLTTC